MSIEMDNFMDNFDPVQEKYLRQREPKLNRLLDNKDIFAIEKDDSGKFTIKYSNGQKFRCSGPLVNRCIKTIFCRETIKKRKLF